MQQTLAPHIGKTTDFFSAPTASDAKTSILCVSNDGKSLETSKTELQKFLANNDPLFLQILITNNGKNLAVLDTSTVVNTLQLYNLSCSWDIKNVNMTQQNEIISATQAMITKMSQLKSNPTYAHRFAALPPPSLSYALQPQPMDMDFGGRMPMHQPPMFDNVTSGGVPEEARAVPSRPFFGGRTAVDGGRVKMPMKMPMKVKAKSSVIGTDKKK